MPSGHPALFASASYSFLLVLCIDRDHHFVCLYLCICISLLLLVVLHILIRSSFCVSACIVYIQSKMQAPSSELFWPSCCQARQVSLLKAPTSCIFTRPNSTLSYLVQYCCQPNTCVVLSLAIMLTPVAIVTFQFSLKGLEI